MNSTGSVLFVRESVSSYPSGCNIRTTVSHSGTGEPGKKKILGISLDAGISTWPLVKGLKVEPKETHTSCLGI